MPFNGGYRIWLGGWGYPFFVPYRFWDPFRFRLGLFIGFNAFYDPLGFYNVYGYPPYPAPYYAYPPARVDTYYDNSDSNSDLRGTVETIDLHSGEVVINESGTNRQVTALLPPRDRRVDNIHPGDYVEFSGQWTNDHYFDAAAMVRFDAR